MTVINNAKWKLLTHSMSQTREHKMLAGYQPSGGGMNKIFFLAPMYNLNDANMDGSVSTLEWWFGKNLYDPYSVFELFNNAADNCCTVDAATQLRDHELFGNARKSMLKASFKAASKALITINIERLLSPGIEANLANTKLAEIGKFSSALIFIVKNGMQTAVEAAINKPRKFYR